MSEAKMEGTNMFEDRKELMLQIAKLTMTLLKKGNFGIVK